MIEPVVIEPDALFDDAALHQALGLTPSTLAAGRRAGTLRYTRRGKRTLYFGRWIIDWLEREGLIEPVEQSTASQPEAARSGGVA
jgi:hypothetical protein